MSKEIRIVCAAIRADNGNVISGVRHYSMDMCMQIQNRTDGDDFKHRFYDDQGFIANNGTYYNRKDAYKIALAANQIKYQLDYETDELFSEMLY